MQGSFVTVVLSTVLGTGIPASKVVSISTFLHLRIFAPMPTVWRKTVTIAAPSSKHVRVLVASHHTVTVPITVTTCTVPIVNCTYGHQPSTLLQLRSKFQLQIYYSSCDIAWLRNTLSRDGKYRDIFKNIVYLWYFRYFWYFRYISDIFDIFILQHWIGWCQLKGLCLSCIFQNGATKNNNKHEMMKCRHICSEIFWMLLCFVQLTQYLMVYRHNACTC